jgi:hypothetical protein
MVGRCFNACNDAARVTRPSGTIEYTPLSNQASRWDADVIRHRIQAVNDLHG